MELTRIRYKKVGTDTLVSKPLLAVLTSYTVTIDLKNMSYTIVDENGKSVAVGREKTRLEMLPRIKNDLKQLGVRFADEVREKRKKKGADNDVTSNALLDPVLVGSERA